MKFTTSLLSVLASALAVSATPIAKRQSAIENSIARWRFDIESVNTFLNTFSTLSDPASAASAVLQIALDEPTQLEFLATQIIGGSEQIPIDVLKQNFPTVPNALKNIIASNNDPAIVKANVRVINAIRCGVVLPNIGVLWENVLGDNVLPLTTLPPGPNFCPLQQ